MERLQKIIAASGVCSRRKAEDLIVSGKVKVNGEIVNQLGIKVSFNDVIEINGKILKREEKITYLLNKPKFYLSSVSDDRGRKCVTELIETNYRIFPVGRLDFESSGLLLMSNDGELTNKLLHPKFKIPKTYNVVVDGIVEEDVIKTLSKGVLLDGVFKTGYSKIKINKKNFNKNTTSLQVTIFEGYNRQIRKMFELFNYKVIQLHRVSFGCVEIGNLKQGESRKLKPFEIITLKKYIDELNDL